MTNEEAAIKLSVHLMACGMLMPQEWVDKNGPGSDLQQAFRLALDALRPEKPAHPTRGDVIRSLNDEDLACALFLLTAGTEAIRFCNCSPECNALLDTTDDIPDEWCINCMLDYIRGEAGGGPWP